MDCSFIVQYLQRRQTGKVLYSLQAPSRNVYGYSVPFQYQPPTGDNVYTQQNEN